MADEEITGSMLVRRATGQGDRPSPTEVLLHQIQHLLHERVRFGPIWEYIWPSGIGLEEPALMLINPYPWSAPLEEVRLKKQ